MILSPVALLAVTLSALSAVIAAATVLMVLWQGAGRLVNRLVALYGAAVFLWCSSVFAGYLEILHGQIVVLLFQGVGAAVGFTAVALLALALCVAELWARPWAKILLTATTLLQIVVAVQLFRGRIIYDIQFVDQRLLYAFDRRGIGLLGVGLLVAPVAVVILYRARKQASRDVLVGSALTMAAILARVIPVVAGYPISIPLVCLAATLFARAVLRVQLFDPAAEANRRLARLAKELRTSEARLSAVLSNTRDAIWSIDADYRVESMNPSARRLFTDTYGVSIKIGSNLLDLGSVDSQTEWLALYRQAILGERVTFEKHFRIGSSKVELEVALSPIIDGEGIIKGASAFARDITGRKRAEAALLKAKKAAEDANLAKSSFLATMSHELRTPLNAILGYAELIDETAREEGGRVDLADLARIKEAGSHLLMLISDILDLSKIEADKMDLRIEAIDVRALVDEVGRIAKPLVEKNGNTLHIEIEGEPGAVCADPTRARQVLLNLLSNAAKFTEKGTITLRALRAPPSDAEPAGGAPGEGGSIQFQIQDTGVGIARDKLGLLFQPFNQIDASMTRKHGGTGLGLALSRRFCLLMNGDITVESEAGKGSRFTVRLPTDMPEVSSTSLPPDRESLPPDDLGRISRPTPFM